MDGQEQSWYQIVGIETMMKFPTAFDPVQALENTSNNKVPSQQQRRARELPGPIRWELLATSPLPALVRVAFCQVHQCRKSHAARRYCPGCH